MGLFDDDDDSTDEQPTTNYGASAANEGEYDDDEEEDPLDAYMKSLNDESHSSNKPNGGSAGGRMDHDAEEEATSHWEISRDARKESGSRLLPKAICGQEDWDDGGGDYGDNGDGQGREAREARSAMSSTFVRAGTKSNSNQTTSKDSLSNQYSVKDDGNYGEDEDEPSFETLQQQHKDQQHQQLHQEIDPLERTNHKQMKYAPFRRKFYNPPNTPQGHAWRKEHDVVCTPDNFDPILGFGELAAPGEGSEENEENDGNKANGELFPPELLRRIAQSGYTSPTPVQSQTLPVALSGHDALITASTGSGKTLAYTWPLIIHSIDQPHIQPGEGPIGTILTPTRELAKQVYKHVQLFLKSVGGKAVEVSGGSRGTWELCKELKKGCEVVVGTPGRVIDVVRRKGTNLGRVTMVVLDEADRMLDMGFEKQVTSILENIRPDRQTLLLSATFGKRVEKVARSWLRNPVRIAVGRTGASSEHVEQHVLALPSRDAKVQWLVEMLPILAPLGRCLIFVATRADCDSVAQILQSSPAFIHSNHPTHAANNATNDSITIVSIHGDKDQQDRNAAISQFKKQSRAILIATDVAARGLDIPNVMTVINFDAAKNMDSHVHRVGRAGRLQKDGDGADEEQHHQRGVAYTLLTEKNADFAQLLVEAFEREGRTVSQELVALSQKSKRFGGGRGPKHRREGLGFGGGTTGVGGSGGQGSQGGNYYGPSVPSAKKSRWG